MNELLLGDCRTLLPAIAGGTIDALITDPPFAINARFGVETRRSGRGHRRLEFEWDRPETAAMVVEGLTLAVEKLKRTASAFVFSGFDSVDLYAKPFRTAGFTVKPAAWLKTCPPPAGAGQRWPSAFELGFYAYRGRAFFGDRDVKRSNVFVHDALRHGNGDKNGHPTQKPLALMRRLVASLVPDGGSVLDCFAGSGTTLRAAAELDRGFVGIECEKKYHRLAFGRVKQWL
jgi:site-specific DNA-methyltransferase (adenine-specific)